MDEGALTKLRTLDFSGCDSLGTLPLSLEVLTSLKKLILLDCQHTLKDSCQKYCEKSSIRSGFHIHMNFRESHSLDVPKSRGWTFSSHDML